MRCAQRLEDRTLLAAFTVNTTADTIDANPGDGVAADATGQTSLRAAIMEANALSGADTIVMPAGTYTLSIGGTFENAAATGDLDVLDDLTITGAGATQTTIDANSIDRVFHVRGGTSGNPVQFNIEDLTVTGGQAIGNSSTPIEDYGGGLRLDFYTDALITGVTFSNNSAPRTGSGTVHGVGGAILAGGTLTIRDSRFENNLATNSGGAIYTTGATGSTLIERTTFADNRAGSGGAIESRGTTTINESLFVGNNDGGSSSGNGGALNIQQGLVRLTNSTITGSDSTFGGGILNYATLIITTSTLTNNSALSGGGIRSTGSVTIENSIVAGNTATGSGPDINGSVTSNGYNIIGDTTDSTGFGATGDQLNVDPLLGPLDNNGGPTLTHALLVGSPAIDAANTATSPAIDQRGIMRPQGADADIGAYEVLASPLTFLVDTLADESDGDFSTGNFSLREAIEQANTFPSADIITFDAALAGETITLSGTQLQVTDSVTINGLGRDLLTIDGNGQSRIFDLTGYTPVVSIDGLTLTGGFVTGNALEGIGGAIRQQVAALTLTNSRLIDNTAQVRGGGLYTLTGQAEIDDVEFLENDANSGGGGFYFQGSNVTVSNSRFVDNTSLGGTGGAINNIRRMTISNSTFIGNMANEGGAIDSSNTGILTIVESSLTENSARYGGAIRVNGNASTGSLVTIVRSTIAGNTADSSGGGLSILGANVVLSGTTISGNTAETYGGGIMNRPISSQTTTIFNSTISGNSTGYHGGGIYNAGPLVVRNSTITQNRADTLNNGIGKGGAIYTLLTANAPTSTLLHNALVAGNLAGTGTGTLDEFGKLGGDPNELNIDPASSHNLIANAATANGLTDGTNGNIVGDGGTGTIPLASILNPSLSSNGGPTLTHTLVADSPAIDAGDNSESVDENAMDLTADQRQSPYARIVDGDDDSTATVDMGAVEVDPTPKTFIVDTLVDESDGDVSSGDLSLREAVELANIGLGDDTILFHASLAGNAIVLGGTELLITDDVTITGLGASQLTISGGGISRIFRIDGVTAGPISVAIDGLTLTDGASVTDSGGAVYNDGGHLQLSNSVVTGNSGRAGGGVGTRNGSLLIEGTTISNNSATIFGGGIVNFQADVTINQSIIDNNSAFDGGGIYANGSPSDRATLIIVDSEITNNDASSFGGGIDLTARVTLHVSGSQLSGNRATGDGGNTGAAGGLSALMDSDVTFVNSEITNNSAISVGGGLIIVDSTLRLENSSVEGNEANGGLGGGIVFSDSTGAAGTTIIGSTIAGNSTSLDGGGLFLGGGQHTIVNSTISGNSAAGVGGGLEDRGATIVIRSSTITGNRADSDGNSASAGGGIFLTNDIANSATTLHNTIVAGNVSGTIGMEVTDDINTATGAVIVAGSSHNLIGDAATSGGLADGTADDNLVGNAGAGTIPIGDILDVTLADNGGPALTHILVVGSLAIDAGDAAEAVDENGDPLATDQRLSDRIVGDLDIGAIEFGTAAPVAPAFMSASINAGSDNRSGIAVVGLTFSEPVTIVAENSFRLFNHTTGMSVSLSGASLVGNGESTVSLDLSALSLMDGHYTVELPADQVASAASMTLNATMTISFYKLAGDANGSGSVNASDFSDVTENFSSPQGPAYRTGDTNGDGFVNASDFSAITANFSKSHQDPETDFGDAPTAAQSGFASSYPTLLGDDGARHIITGNTLFLGAGRDADADGQPDATATGDNSDGNDDENGIVVGNLERGTSVSVSVTANVPGGSPVLNGWIDFNQDGDWDDEGEQVFTDEPLVDGTQGLLISVPGEALLGTTYARFRITSTAGYSYFGLAPDGEVEDYQLNVTDPPPPPALPMANAWTTAAWPHFRGVVNPSTTSGGRILADNPQPRKSARRW